MIGIRVSAPHPEHFARLPACSSFAVSFFPHDSHENSIAIDSLCEALPLAGCVDSNRTARVSAMIGGRKFDLKHPLVSLQINPAQFANDLE
jgi:hypothetical protein